MLTHAFIPIAIVDSAKYYEENPFKLQQKQNT